MAELSVRDLVVKYGETIAVDRISFTVGDGEFVSLLGPSGCGKTTTLRCIAGLESASAGEIRIGGEVVALNGREVPPEKRGVNMVFQSYAVWPHMTVFENVAYGLRTQRMDRDQIRERTAEALRLVGLSAFEQRFGTELSGGQQQRVAVARAVVTAPQLLLFDEPLSNLDAGLRERMRFELVQLQRSLGRTSVYVTHDQSEAMVMSDRIILMNHGRVVQESTPRELYEHPASRFAAEFVGNANLIPAQIAQDHGGGRLTVVGEGLRLDALVPAAPTPNSPFLICLRPENIIPATDNDAANSFRARVTRMGYLGHSLNCELRCGDLTLRADLPSRTRLSEGDELTFHVAPECVVLVPDGAD